MEEVTGEGADFIKSLGNCITFLPDIKTKNFIQDIQFTQIKQIPFESIIRALFH
jgi:hypothetical protein